MGIIAKRYHDFSCGHTVTGHESACKHLHGHNYRVTFYVKGRALDTVGRVLDFSVIKTKLCQWIEDNWDHKFLINEKDPRTPYLEKIDSNSLVICNFNPTAENMASFLLHQIGPSALEDTDCYLSKVELSETRKCGVEVSID